MTGRTFKPVAVSRVNYINAKDLEESGKTGIILEGVYVAAIPNQFDDTKNDYKFETEDGRTVVINNTGGLRYQMDKVAPGTLVQITYNGKEKMTTGKNAGKLAHNFLVSIANEA